MNLPRLDPAALPALAAGVSRPAYDREALAPGIPGLHYPLPEA